MNKAILLLTFLSCVFCSSSVYDKAREEILKQMAELNPKYLSIMTNVKTSLYVFENIQKEDKAKEIEFNFKEEFPEIKNALELIFMSSYFEGSDSTPLTFDNDKDIRGLEVRGYYSFTGDKKIFIFGKTKGKWNQKLLRMITFRKHLEKKVSEDLVDTLQYIFLKEVLKKINELSNQ